MSAAVTSSMTWCALRPLIAANMLSIIGASSPCDAASSVRSGRWLVFLAVVAFFRLGDYGRVDVGENVVLHVVAIDRRDDGAIADRHDKGRVVDEDDRLARALAGGTVDALAEARDRRLPHLDPATLNALDRMAGELDALRVAQDLPERRAGRRRDAARGLHGRIERRRQRAGRDDRRVVRELAHRTWVTAPASMPPLPSTVRVAVPSLPMSTAETTPVWAVLVVASV